MKYLYYILMLIFITLILNSCKKKSSNEIKFSDSQIAEINRDYLVISSLTYKDFGETLFKIYGGSKIENGTITGYNKVKGSEWAKDFSMTLKNNLVQKYKFGSTIYLTYNENNQVTKMGDKTFKYDKNKELLSIINKNEIRYFSKNDTAILSNTISKKNPNYIFKHCIYFDGKNRIITDSTYAKFNEIDTREIWNYSYSNKKLHIEKHVDFDHNEKRVERIRTYEYDKVGLVNKITIDFPLHNTKKVKLFEYEIVQEKPLEIKKTTIYDGIKYIETIGFNELGYKVFTRDNDGNERKFEYKITE